MTRKTASASASWKASFMRAASSARPDPRPGASGRHHGTRARRSTTRRRARGERARHGSPGSEGRSPLEQARRLEHSTFVQAICLAEPTAISLADPRVISRSRPASHFTSGERSGGRSNLRVELSRRRTPAAARPQDQRDPRRLARSGPAPARRLIAEVCKLAGTRCVWVDSRTHEDLVNGLGSGAIDLAYLGGVTFARAYHRHGAIALAIRDVDAAFTSAVVVRSDSDATPRRSAREAVRIR